ncbi:phasin family protein [Massilia sp. UMI-21]|nr:phasin family protein [Massilia sp. UMI-21]
MDRKLKELARSDDAAMLDAVCSSAHQIWQAGLGAFARAQREGSELFEKLVQDGGELQKLTQRFTGGTGVSVTDTVTRLAENAGRQASGSLDKLEKMFEDRVARSLRNLGLPAPEEVQALGRDVAELKAALHTAGMQARADIDALTQAVDALRIANSPAPAKKATARPARQAGTQAPAKKAAAGTARKAAAKARAKPAAKPAAKLAAKRPTAKKTAAAGPR